MNRHARLLLVALLGVVLLSSGGYYAFRTHDRDPRKRLPMEPSVQERPDLTARYRRLHDAIAGHDQAARLAVLLEITRFQDAAVAPLQEEAEHALDAPDDGPFLSALVEALGRIGTQRAQSALLSLAYDASRRGAHLADILAALDTLPERSRTLALQALLTALRAAPDEAAAATILAAFPKHARPVDAALLAEAAASLPEPRREALSRIASDLDRQQAAETLASLDSVDDAERILLGGPDAVPPKPLPPQAADVLAQAEAAAKKAPPSEQVRLAAVHWLEGKAAQTPCPEAIRVLERASASFTPAVDALARLAGRGDQDALAALQRLHTAGPREPLVARLTLYATKATAALLAEWASDPALPKDIASQAQRSAEAVRRTPR